MEELCEKESKIRSLEVFSLELKTETDLEKEKNANLNAELDLLHKQVTAFHYFQLQISFLLFYLYLDMFDA